MSLTAKVNGACRHGGMATKRGRRDSQGECCLTRMPSLVGNVLQPGVRKPVLQKLGHARIRAGRRCLSGAALQARATTSQSQAMPAAAWTDPFALDVSRSQRRAEPYAHILESLFWEAGVTSELARRGGQERLQSARTAQKLLRDRPMWGANAYACVWCCCEPACNAQCVLVSRMLQATALLKDHGTDCCVSLDIT